MGEAETPQTLMTALLAVQAELPKLEKSAVNPHFKSRYISLDVLMAEVMPILNKHGLVWITLPVRDDAGEPALLYRLVFTWSQKPPGYAIEFEGKTPPVVVDNGLEEVSGTMPLLASKDDPQGQGAAITYARRYSLTAVLGITADEDDDGNRATAARQASARRAQETRAAPIDPEAPMSADGVQKMVAAITAAGFDLDEIREKAGIAESETPTVAQGRKVKELIS